MKNIITLYYGCGEEKEEVKLYNFESLDHYIDPKGKHYIRICCGGAYNYFHAHLTTIKSIKIYE